MGLDVPRHTAKQIHEWAMDQPWPEGTELEPPSEYHVTLMYTPSGYEQHKDAWWIEHMERGEAKVQSVKAFDGQDKGYAYVLKLDAPEVKQRAEDMQGRAEAIGLDITHFPGGYQPHLTVAYGPASRLTGVDVPNFSFDLGPSSVSSPRPVTAAYNRVSYADFDPDGETGSLTRIALFLHGGFEGGRDVVPYASQLLLAAGYPDDELTLVAAVQTWQELYPSDVAQGKFAPSDRELSYSLSHKDDRKTFKQPDQPDEDEPKSTVPSEVMDPEDHWPEFGDVPPDQKRDIQFSGDWTYKG